MENTEGIVGSVRRWLGIGNQTGIKPPDIPPVEPSGWNYEIFREYLLAISRGRDFLLPIGEYPPSFELSGPWHETLNQIRGLTHEGWFLIGYEMGQRRLVLPRVAERGLSHSVPAEVMQAGLEKARKKAHITDYVGDAHSHPRGLRDLSWTAHLSPSGEGSASFSLGDLYCLLYGLRMQRPSDPRRFVMFVAEGNENIAAFATRGSLERVRNSFTDSHDKFVSKWYQKFGWEYLGRGPEGGEMARSVKDNAPTEWKITKAVAHHYQLALYRGFKDGPLRRNYPAIITV